MPDFIKHPKSHLPLLTDLKTFPLLRECWPEIFTPGNPRPLARRIERKMIAVLKAAGISPHYYVRELDAYKSRIRYLEGLAKAQNRIDLDGVEVEPVEESERQEAKATAKMRRANHQRRKNRAPQPVQYPNQKGVFMQL